MSVPPPELKITLGRRAYRRPVGLSLAGLALGLVFSLATMPAGEAWTPGLDRRVIVFCGGAGVLIALAGALWALVLHRSRLIVTIGEKGLVLRRGEKEAVVPAAAVDAVGITWPVGDPVWTVWFDPEAVAGVGAVAKVGADGRAATLLRDGSLPSGWLPAVRAATTGTLGAGWRVVDDAGAEVPPPPADALSKADRVLVDGTGRYRDERGGGLLAIACGRPAGGPEARSGALPLASDRGRRTVVLRDPHAGTLLVFKRTSRLPGRDRLRVLDADGRLVGEVRGGHEPSFHAAGGMFLGAARHAGGGRYVVTGVDGRESASLRTESGADDGRMRLTRSPSAPAALRTLTLALPIAVRIARQS